jgi:site-specific DNA-methyltransferase (adenine-specific)
MSESWTILTGDCLNILAGMEAGSARLCFCDPPYNIRLSYDGYDDNLPEPEYRAWCREWLAAIHRVLADDGSAWVLLNHEQGWQICAEAVESVGFHLRQWLTWYESFGTNATNKFGRRTRPLLHLVKDPKRFVFHADEPSIRCKSARQTFYKDPRANVNGRLWSDCWGIDRPIHRVAGTHRQRLKVEGQDNPPTQLPVDLLRPIILCASNPFDLVVDPFAGSGTSGAACIETGRRFVGIELSERYATLARRRLANTTPSLPAVV